MLAPNKVYKEVRSMTLTDLNTTNRLTDYRIHLLAMPTATDWLIKLAKLECHVDTGLNRITYLIIRIIYKLLIESHG